MTLHRSFAILVLAASLSGGALAQTGTDLDDETIFIAVDDTLRGVTGVANEIRVANRPSRA